VLEGLVDHHGTLAETTAGAILDGPVGRASRFAAENIEDQLTTLRAELQLTGAEIVRIPVLYTWQTGNHYVKALTGNTVNGVAPGGRTFLAPDPHGPWTATGGDLFRAATTTALRRVGVTPRFVETWPMPHLGTGELHCMTNALRDLGGARWWLSGGR
jgi:protein-arginine deiminase